MTTEYVIQGCDVRHKFDAPIDCPFCALEAQAREIAELKAWHAAGYAGQLEKRLAEREETIRKFGTVQHGLLCRAEAAESQLAEAERFIEEIRDESAEDWRTRRYVVVQMTEETWDKLRAWKVADDAAMKEGGE